MPATVTKVCEFCSQAVEYAPDRKVHRINGYWICSGCSSSHEVMQLTPKSGVKLGTQS